MTEQNVNLAPEVVNVRVRRGDAWSYRATINGVDLTGYTIAAQLRGRIEDDTAIDLDISPDDLTIGRFYVGQDEATISGYYDVQITPPSGLPRTYIAGRLAVDADVTRS